MRRALLFLILVFCAGAASIGAETNRPTMLPPEIVAALSRAREVRIRIQAAIGPEIRPTQNLHPLGDFPVVHANLADYAKSTGAEPERFETFAESARRVLAGGSTTKITPAQTSRWLDAAADDLLAIVRPAESVADQPKRPELATALAELRVTAQLARFHARRCIAAVHYNLFTRGLKLAELLAATMQEKQAVAAWRELVTAADAASTPIAIARADLKRLESSLRELEEQCCPPDEAILREPVWNPTTEQPK